MHHKILLRLLAIMLFLGGCARQQMAQSEIPESETVTVRVENQNASMIRVFVSTGSLNQWIGTVQAEQNDSFTVPGAMLHGPTQVTFTAEAVRSGARYVTPNFVVKPGNIVRLEVASSLNFSNWTVQ
jgi:hypothetical protein